MEDFREKVCVVTGAASGIGYAISQALLEAGASVVMADRDAATLTAAFEGLGDLRRQAVPATVDVAVEEQVRHLVEETAARQGRLDLLFNNAGIGATMPFGQATLEHWRRLVDVDLWSVIYGVHHAIPIMRRQGSGHIVNTASLAGIVPFPFQALYCTVKFGVVGLSESLRLELEDDGIAVSVVCPGNVQSRIWGTPVFGERGDVAAPTDAIPADEAARVILEGVARKDGIIVVPRSLEPLFRGYWAASPDTGELLRQMARQRRESYLAKGSYY